MIGVNGRSVLEMVFFESYNYIYKLGILYEVLSFIILLNWLKVLMIFMLKEMFNFINDEGIK